MTSSLLYIDPGTGSMLFSILIGATATLYFLARAAVLKLKFLFTGKKGTADVSAHKYVIYNGIFFFKIVCHSSTIIALHVIIASN